MDSLTIDGINQIRDFVEACGKPPIFSEASPSKCPSVFYSFFQSCSSVDHISNLKKVYQILEDAFASLYGRDKICLRPFGSCITNLSDNLSDLDVVLRTDDIKDFKKSDIRRFLDHDLSPSLSKKLLELKREQQITKFTLNCISHANTPIISLKIWLSDIPQPIEVDISFQVKVSVFNSCLIASYVNQNPLTGPLIRFIKTWAKKRQVQGARNYFFSSYSLTLMTLYYLLHKNPLSKPSCNLLVDNEQSSGFLKNLMSPQALVQGNPVIKFDKDYKCNERKLYSFAFDCCDQNFIHLLSDEKSEIYDASESIGGCIKRSHSDIFEDKEVDLRILAEGFFCFYLFEFNWETEIVDIATTWEHPNRISPPSLTLERALCRELARSQGISEHKVTLSKDLQRFLLFYNSGENNKFPLKPSSKSILIRDPFERNYFLTMGDGQAEIFRNELMRAWILLVIGGDAIDKILMPFRSVSSWETSSVELDHQRGEDASNKVVHAKEYKSKDSAMRSISPQICPAAWFAEGFFEDRDSEDLFMNLKEHLLSEEFNILEQLGASKKSIDELGKWASNSKADLMVRIPTSFVQTHLLDEHGKLKIQKNASIVSTSCSWTAKEDSLQYKTASWSERQTAWRKPECHNNNMESNTCSEVAVQWVGDTRNSACVSASTESNGLDIIAMMLSKKKPSSTIASNVNTVEERVPGSNSDEADTEKALNPFKKWISQFETKEEMRLKKSREEIYILNPEMVVTNEPVRPHAFNLIYSIQEFFDNPPTSLNLNNNPF